MPSTAASPERVKTCSLRAGDLIRLDLRDPAHPRPARAVTRSSLVSVISLTRRQDVTRWPGQPYELIVRRGNGARVTLHLAAHVTQMVGRHRYAIDADCPSCGWGERWFDPQMDRFGCNKCDYLSKYRDA